MSFLPCHMIETLHITHFLLFTILHLRRTIYFPKLAIDFPSDKSTLYCTCDPVNDVRNHLTYFLLNQPFNSLILCRLRTLASVWSGRLLTSVNVDSLNHTHVFLNAGCCNPLHSLLSQLLNQFRFLCSELIGHS
jgi:hypothetical protein